MEGNEMRCKLKNNRKRKKDPSWMRERKEETERGAKKEEAH